MLHPGVGAAMAIPALLGAVGPAAGTQTIGLFVNEPGVFEGYTLFEARQYTDTYLINNDGLLVRSWHSDYDTGNQAYLLEDGHILRGANPGSAWFQTPGGSGLVQEFDWDGNLAWEFSYSDSTHRHHHDIAHLPNGNVLMIAWELRTWSEAMAAGRDPTLIWDGEVWPDHIVEVEPVGVNGGSVVWEWHAWDHLIQDFDATKDNYGVVAEHPELIDINYTTTGTGAADWMHSNSIAYNAALDQIVLSVNQFSEFWIIDHSTTTAQAAGHTGGARGRGGDLLYRWGNPEAYDRGTAADRVNYRQHDAHWIADGLSGAGNILLFNNGQSRPEGEWSSVEEIQTTVDGNGDYPTPASGMPHDPAVATWTFTTDPPESLYSQIMSSAQRLPNGNTLICEGAPSANFHEYDPAGNLVWLYVNPVGTDGPLVQGEPPVLNSAFRCIRYAPDYPGFVGRDLTPGDPIELPPNATQVAVTVGLRSFELRQNYPNPVREATTLSFALRDPGFVSLDVHDVAGRRVTTVVDGRLGSGEHRFLWRPTRLASGVYHYTLRVGADTETREMVVVR